jgi:uncharacterized protein YbjT (DUF2867 family)
MANEGNRTVVVTGATGHQGSAVTRHLLKDGWQVRALTRNPQSAKAQALGKLGATLVTADFDDPASLRIALAGAYGAYSVQNPYPRGTNREVKQGKNVADAAKEAGIQHIVYGSAGTGEPGSGIPSWESKLLIEEQMRRLDLPLTVLRPMAFMELMTDKQFFPPVAVWHVMPLLMGPSVRVPWLCAEDLGAIAAVAFSQPERFVGQDLKLASDVQSIDDCRRIYREVAGKNPPRFPLPPAVFSRFGFVGKDLSTMWRWLSAKAPNVDPKETREIHPGALTVKDWLGRQMA